MQEMAQAMVEELGPVTKIRSWADRLGICLSALCIVHCLLTPVLLLFLPTLQFLDNHDHMHEWMVVVIPAFAVAAFVPGYIRHRKFVVFLWAFLGLFLILFAVVNPLDLVTRIGGEWAEHGITILGSLSFIRAHFLNRKFCACCANHHH